MNIGQAQVAVVIAVNVLDAFFKALHAAGVIPPVSSADRTTPVGRRNVTTLLFSPLFEMAGPANNPRTLLNLTGEIELRAEGVTSGFPDATFPLNIWVRLDVILRERPGEAPYGCLVYGGVDQPVDFPLTDEMVDDFFNSPEIQQIFGDLQLEIVAPIIESLETNLFPDDDDPPAPDSWSAAVRLQRASNAGSVDALAVQVALPGEDATGGDEASFLPALTEFGIIYSRRLLDTMLGRQAAELEGSEVDDATITNLSLVMGNDALLLNGRAEQDNAVITFIGPVRMSLMRGTYQFAVDAQEISVDVDLPWWADVLLFFMRPAGGLLTLGLGPLFGSMILASQGTSLGEIEVSVGAAPFLVKGSISASLSDGLEALANGLVFETAVGNTQPESTPDHSRVENGHIGVFAQVFIKPLFKTIVDGRYSQAQRRFREFQLEGGRWLSSPELARIVKTGRITTPGYHGVERTLSEERVLRYMRANPDREAHNNLLEQFKSD